MISKKIFTLLLVFALVLIILQLLSGIWLFIEKFGLTVNEVYTYFAGSQDKFIMAKSFEGLMETAVPHFIAVSTTIFVYAHFLLFTDIISQKSKQILIFSLFTASLIDIFSGFGMIYGYKVFAYLKITAFISFEVLMAILLYILFLISLRAYRA